MFAKGALSHYFEYLKMKMEVQKMKTELYCLSLETI